MEKNSEDLVNLISNILNDIDLSWCKISKCGKGVVNFNFIPFTIKINIKIEFGNFKNESHVMFKEYDDIIMKINTMYGDTNKMKSKDKIFSDVVHEIVHISQNLNGFIEYSNSCHIKNFKSQKEFEEYYTKNHEKFTTEKDAVLYQFFELLKRDKVKAYNLLIDLSKYFDLYSYKKLINKAYKYGVNMDDIYFIKNKLQTLLKEKVEKIEKEAYFFDNYFQEINKNVILFEKFNINYKPDFKKLKKILDKSNPKRMINHKLLKIRIDELLK